MTCSPLLQSVLLQLPVKRSLADAQDLCGLFSFQFERKTRLDGQTVLRHIEENPGYDGYLYNWHAARPYLGWNIWHTTDAMYPGFLAHGQAVIDAAGYDLRLDQLDRQTADRLVFSNAWIGSARLWDAFITFMRPLRDAVEADHALYDRLMQPFSVHGHRRYPYLPIVFERLSMTFFLVQRDLTFCAYRRTREDRLRQAFMPLEHEIITGFADMIDAWDAAGDLDAAQRGVMDNLTRIMGDHYRAIDGPSQNFWSQFDRAR